MGLDLLRDTDAAFAMVVGTLCLLPFAVGAVFAAKDRATDARCRWHTRPAHRVLGCGYCFARHRAATAGYRAARQRRFAAARRRAAAAARSRARAHHHRTTRPGLARAIPNQRTGGDR